MDTPSATELYNELSGHAGGLKFPRAPHALIREIRELRATLEQAGILFEDLPDGQRTKRITRRLHAKIASVASKSAEIGFPQTDGTVLNTVNEQSIASGDLLSGIENMILGTDGILTIADAISKIPSGQRDRNKAKIDAIPFKNIKEKKREGEERSQSADTGTEDCKLEFYASHPTSVRWNDLRSEALKRDDNACVICGKPGEEVDHVREIWEGGPEFDLDNLQSLCYECHVTKTNESRRRRNESKDIKVEAG